MTRGDRGTALAETALMVGLATLIIFNGLQLAIMGFMQLHTDAIAFTAARYVAEGGTQASYPASIFPPTVTLSAPAPTGQIAQATATKSVGGLIMLGAAPSVTVRGEHQEALWATSVSSVPSFSISETNTRLPNFYNGVKNGVAESTRQICLAHSINPTGNGNGKNAVFAAFQAHADTFKALGNGNGLPNSWSATLDPQWDITNKKFNSNEATVYGWDKTATNTGSSYCNASDI